MSFLVYVRANCQERALSLFLINLFIWVRTVNESGGWRIGLHSVNDQVEIEQKVSVDVPDIVGTESDVSRPFDIHI